MFYFFYKINISRLNKVKMIYEAYMYTVTFLSRNCKFLETANHIADVIFVLYIAMKTQLLANQNTLTVKTIYKVL